MFSAEMEQRCRLLSTELSELRQRLAAERQHRSHADDMLRQAHEQLQLQQQLTSRTCEQVSVRTTVVIKTDDSMYTLYVRACTCCVCVLYTMQSVKITLMLDLRRFVDCWLYL